MPFPSLTSQKTQWNSDKNFFGEIFNFSLYFHQKSAILSSAMSFEHYDVTVTSYLRCWYLFWYVWKKETPSYTMVPITCIWGFHFQVHRGVVTTPLVNCVTKNGWMVGRGLMLANLKGLIHTAHLCAHNMFKGDLYTYAWYEPPPPPVWVFCVTTM